MVCTRSGKGDEQNLDFPINRDKLLSSSFIFYPSGHPGEEYSWIWNWHTKSSTSYLHNMHSIPGLCLKTCLINRLSSIFHKQTTPAKNRKIWFSAMLLLSLGLAIQVEQQEVPPAGSTKSKGDVRSTSEGCWCSNRWNPAIYQMRWHCSIQAPNQYMS